MAWTKYQVFLALLMVATGSINTLATKWADETYSEGKDGGGPKRQFNHPFLQACSMFLGEMMCMGAFFFLSLLYKHSKSDGEPPSSIAGNNNFNPLIFLPPALCDLMGTSIMYVGLNLTSASSFQMLRGAVIVFTGLLSVAFLERVLKSFHWAGIFSVIAGLVIVGVAGIIFDKPDTHGRNSVITGDLLIVIAQIIVATQMVIEEKFISKYNVPPLKAVGWEGTFGFGILALLLIPMYYIPVGHSIFTNPDGNLEDAIDGFIQIGNNWQVLTGIVGTVLSIAFFNFAGISVTKELSATTRMILDSVRTLIIWFCSMAIGWEDFNYIKMIGFIVLLFGMCLYNDIIIRPTVVKVIALRKARSEFTEKLIVEPDVEQDGNINNSEKC